MKKALYILFVILILLSSLVIPVSAEESYPKGVISENAVLLNSADVYGDITYTVYEEHEVLIREELGDYLDVVVLGDNGLPMASGYCDKQSIKLLYNGMTNDTANIRDIPGKSGNKLGMFLANVQLTIYGDKVSGWYEVEGICDGETVRGYCYSDYIDVGEQIYAEIGQVENSETSEDFPPADTVDLSDTVINETLYGTSDVRWYEFEITEACGAEIAFKTTEDELCVWNYELYDSEGNFITMGFSAPLSEYSAQFEQLGEGRYYLKLDQSYSDLPISFEISLTLNRDEVALPESDNKTFFYDESAFLFAIDATEYYKGAMGKAVLGTGKGKDGLCYAILVAATKNAAEMTCDNENYAYIENGSLKYNGKTHYYSYAYYSSDPDVDKITDGLYKCNNGKSTRFVEDDAYELLNIYYGEEPSDGRYNIIRRFQKGDWLFLILCLAGIIVILVIIFFILRAWLRRVRRCWR